MTDIDSDSVEFDTVVTAIGNNTGIVVPAEVIDRLGAGKRPPDGVVRRRAPCDESAAMEVDESGQRFGVHAQGSIDFDR